MEIGKAIVVPVAKACELRGCGRTKLYEEINAGLIEAKKDGRRTLVVVKSIKDRVTNLPAYKSA